MPVSQKELASHLSISQVTVSRALRGSKGVSEKLRRTILEGARRLGYSIEASNHEARIMRRRALGQDQATDIICAVVPDGDDASGFNGRILRGIIAEGARIKCEVASITWFRNDLPLIVSRRQVDGMVRVLGDIDVAHGRVQCPVPWVSVLYDVPGIDLVAVDSFGGARDVGRHLYSLGHRRIAFIGPDSDLARERLAGLRAAAEEAKIDFSDSHVYLRRFVASEGPTAELIDEILAQHARKQRGLPPFTALVAYNDYMAAVAIRRLREKGVKIPQEISVSGFDGALPRNFPDESITTARIPLEELGAEGARLLSWRLANPAAPRRRLALGTEFFPGKSVAPPRDT